MTLDVAAARARFSVLQRDLVFFDGPGGTQVPDEVIEAIAGYLRESNANVNCLYETSRRTEALDLADLERQLSDRTRVVAFPVASNAVGTLTDVRRIADLAHEAEALAWADAVHYNTAEEVDRLLAELERLKKKL